MNGERQLYTVIKEVVVLYVSSNEIAIHDNDYNMLTLEEIYKAKFNSFRKTIFRYVSHNTSMIIYRKF